MTTWVKKWEVESLSEDKTYVVSIDAYGNYGCSCPVWKFKRRECKHIKEVQNGGGRLFAPMEEEKTYKPVKPRTRRKVKDINLTESRDDAEREEKPVELSKELTLAERIKQGATWRI
jgi:hypothetical protein